MRSFSNLSTYISEFLGTFILIFAGTGAVVFNDFSGGAITHVGISLTFGLIVLAVIYTFGEISGAHINPAVTIGFWLSKRFEGKKVIPYMTSQCLGALSASLILAFLIDHHATYGATLPAGSQTQSFILEIILTWWLMLVVLMISEGAKEKGIVAGIVVGAVVTLEALFAGPISGASMNPARSLGPAIVSGHVETLWIYIFAPIIGSMLAVLNWYLLCGKNLSASVANAAEQESISCQEGM